MAPELRRLWRLWRLSPDIPVYARARQILSPRKKTRKTRHFGPPLLASTFQVTGQPAVRLGLAQNHDKHDEFS